MPPLVYEDDEIEELYLTTEEVLEQDGKGETNTVIMGERNNVVVDKSYGNTVGPYGLGRRNQRGHILIYIYERNGLVITHTWFKKPKKKIVHLENTRR